MNIILSKYKMWHVTGDAASQDIHASESIQNPVPRFQAVQVNIMTKSGK